jgi:hypothetical protein
VFFLQGCDDEREKSSVPSSIEQDIKHTRDEASSFADFEDKLVAQGFVKINSTSQNKLGDDVTFNYSLFRKANLNYVHIEFTGGTSTKDNLTIGFDTEETTDPTIICSDGLSSPTDFYHLEASNGLDKQWVGIYFESKQSDKTPNGEIVLNSDNGTWRGHF